MDKISSSERFDACASCLFGLEGPLANELRHMGMEAVAPENGRVRFSADAEGSRLAVSDGENAVEIADAAPEAARTARYSATLTAAGWSASAPYTQTASAAGVLSTDDPFVDVDMSGASGSAQGTALTEAWGFVGRVTAGNGQITAYCYEDKPAVNLPVILKVVR